MTWDGTGTAVTGTLYASVTEFKAYQRITSTDTTDDGVITDIIEGASRLIDTTTRRTFYARTATNLYDVPDGEFGDGDILYIEDDDLLTVTTLTNGDATVLTTSDYILLPNNSSPKWGIKLKDSSTKSWESDTDGNDEQAISIAGTWGWSATAPDDVKEACLQIASAYYHRRFGENMTADTTISSGGVVITPQDIPASAKSILMKYERLA